MTLDVAVRPMRDIDTPLIYSSWLRSYRGSADRRIATDVFYRRHHELVERILRHPDTRVSVLTPADDPNTILGWSCRTGTTLHYVYVKEAFRRLGFGARLAEGFSTHTHWTPYGEYLLNGQVYDPYAIS